MTGQFLPKARKDNLIVQTLDDEILLYDTRTDQAHVLNRTAATVWNLANGHRTASNIAVLVARERHSQPDAELVWLALNQLSKANLLVQPVPAVPGIAKLTRREFLQKAALAAVVIPVVKTISAPGPMQGASCSPCGGFCNTVADCCECTICASNECTCFTAGTLVLYNDGTRRPIETVHAGDLVLARDEFSGIVAPQRVEKTYAHHNREAFTLHFGTSALETTSTHPFYTDTGWVKAIDLRPGMDCYRENGSRLTVQQVEHPLAQRQTVYNLQVAGFHTYFVGTDGVWVHNRTVMEDIPLS